jgi:hypothetical protein
LLTPIHVIAGLDPAIQQAKAQMKALRIFLDGLPGQARQ